MAWILKQDRRQEHGQHEKEVEESGQLLALLHLAYGASYGDHQGRDQGIGRQEKEGHYSQIAPWHDDLLQFGHMRRSHQQSNDDGQKVDAKLGQGRSQQAQHLAADELSGCHGRDHDLDGPVLFLTGDNPQHVPGAHHGRKEQEERGDEWQEDVDHAALTKLPVAGNVAYDDVRSLKEPLLPLVRHPGQKVQPHIVIEITPDLPTRGVFQVVEFGVQGLRVIGWQDKEGLDLPRLEGIAARSLIGKSYNLEWLRRVVPRGVPVGVERVGMVHVSNRPAIFAHALDQDAQRDQRDQAQRDGCCHDHKAALYHRVVVLVPGDQPEVTHGAPPAPALPVLRPCPRPCHRSPPVQRCRPATALPAQSVRS